MAFSDARIVRLVERNRFLAFPDVAEEVVQEYVRLGEGGSFGGSGERRVPGCPVLFDNGRGVQEVHRGRGDTRPAPSRHRRGARARREHHRALSFPR